MLILFIFNIFIIFYHLFFFFYLIIGHKNYLFQPLLVSRLVYSSFRFDFRGNGESDGTMTYGGIDVSIVNN